MGSGLSGSLWLMVPVPLMPGASSSSDILGTCVCVRLKPPCIFAFFFDGEACLLGEEVEGAESAVVVAPGEGLRVEEVGLGLPVVGGQLAEAVEEGTAVFTGFVGDGVGQGHELLIVGGDVELAAFNFVDELTDDLEVRFHILMFHILIFHIVLVCWVLGFRLVHSVGECIWLRRRGRADRDGRCLACGG